jgi:tetratricopeptide (TPR) repeat protein
LEAARRAQKLYALPEAINHYWQALDLTERLPRTPKLSCAHTDTILSLVQLPGWMRDETGKARLSRHLKQALAETALFGQEAALAKLEAVKGFIWEDEALFLSAIERAEALSDPLAQAFVAVRYGNYLGWRGQFEDALGHVARAIDFTGAQGDLLSQGIMMAHQGRCYNARAGRLDDARVYAARAREAAKMLGDPRLRASLGMEAELCLYKGDWDEAIRVSEEALPIAQEFRQWDVLLWSSGWAAIAYLKLGRFADAQRILSHAFAAVPMRALNSPMNIAYPKIGLAQLHLAAGDKAQALNAACEALRVSEQGRLRLEQGAAHRVLGQVHEAMGNRAEADAAFHRSIEVLEKNPIPSRAGTDAVGLWPLPSRRQYPARRRNDRARPRLLRGDERDRMGRGGTRRIGCCLTGW